MDRKTHINRQISGWEGEGMMDRWRDIPGAPVVLSLPSPGTKHDWRAL